MSIEVNESKDRISAFLSENNAGVLATANSNGNPHAATVYVTCDRQMNIYFVTKKDTQKSRNIEANPHAAIAIYNQSAQTTVQAEGKVIEVTDPVTQEWVFNDIWNIAFKVSRTGPPITQINAGGYIVYKLSAPSMRIARFNDALSEYEHMFEVIHAQPSQL